jgi:hypothetical protein
MSETIGRRGRFDGLFVAPSGFSRFERGAGGGATAILDGVEFEPIGYIARDDGTYLRVWVPKGMAGGNVKATQVPA